MKRARLLFLGLLFLGLCGSSNAFAIDLYGFGSYWNQEDVDGTWGVGLGLSLPLLTEHLRLDGRAYFFENSDIGRDDSLSATPFDLGLQAHILPTGQVDPYLLGGVSYIYVDADRINADSDFGGYIGAGLDVELGISLVKIFGEVIYRFSTIERDFREDIDVSGFTGNIGVKIHF